MSSGYNQEKRRRFIEEALPHQASLYRAALGFCRNAALAEDLVQDTYKEAWNSFHRYTSGSDCKAWLFRIFFRVWARYRSQAARMTEVEMIEIPVSQLSVEPDFARRLEHETVLKMVGSLPNIYQDVLILADVEEFSYREIAEILELPMGTVMSRLNRARQLFRQKLLSELKSMRSA